MIGKNVPLALVPGIFSNLSRYAAGASWWDGNLVRWNDSGVLKPVGGWQTLYNLNSHANPIRELFSWSDNTAIGYLASGSLLTALVRKNTDGTLWDVTPSDLVTTASGATGYGSGSYGIGRYGLDSSNNSSGGSDSKFSAGYWTFDSWGEDLLAVHSTDGRLLNWSPDTPTSDLAVVANAPIGNRLCITTDERHAMVLGGKNSPRRVKWCSREDLTLWAAAADNSAGGWELDTTGEILSAVKVPQGILVATDVDIHLIEYIGPPEYYARRLMTDETGIVGPKAMAPIPNGAIIAGLHAFWAFNGGINKLPCSLSDKVFIEGNMAEPMSCFMGINESNQEVWFFYPGAGEVATTRYVSYKYTEGHQWWSKGMLSRTAWLNPNWGDRPIGASGTVIYEHERGWTDDGADRDVYAETGAIDIAEGDHKMAVKQLFQDTIMPLDYVSGNPIPYELSFKRASAPQGPETVYGPIVLNVAKGYTTLRFKARQVAMKLEETVASDWGLGKPRIKVMPIGDKKWAAG